MGIKDLKSNIEKKPLKYYLWLIISLTAFFIIILIITSLIAYPTLESQTEYIFNSTNLSSISTNINTPSADNPISIDLLTSTIVLIGAFGVFCYIFFSIQDGSLFGKKQYFYGFLGFLIIIISIDSFYFCSFFKEIWQSPKLLEFIFLVTFFFVTAIIALSFNLIFNIIYDNYNNRASIINFLERKNQEYVISRFWDSFSREIIQMNQTFAMYIFLLIISMIFFGITLDFNIFTILLIILLTLLIFNAYSQLILLEKPSSNIELIKQNILVKSSSLNYNYPTRFSNVFILNDSNDFITILTKTEDSKKILCLSKGCICSIQDNDYSIYRDEKYLYLWIIKRGVFLILFMILFYVIFLILKFLFLPTQSWLLFLSIISFCAIISFYCIYKIKSRIYDLIERIIN